MDEHEVDQHTLTAYHEAGHVVASLVLCIPFDGVSVWSVEHWREGEEAGRMHATRWPGVEVAPADRVVICLAGPMAESLYETGLAEDGMYTSGAEGDMAEVATLTKGLTPPAYRQLVQRAEKLVRKHWPAVERIAQALARCSFLPHHEAASLFAGVALSRSEALARYTPDCTYRAALIDIFDR